jgi:hypothetical protein
MARATSDAPWGPLYGCLCSQPEPFDKVYTSAPAADRTGPDEGWKIWSTLAETSLARLLRSSVKNLLGTSRLHR